MVDRTASIFTGRTVNSSETKNGVALVEFAIGMLVLTLFLGPCLYLLLRMFSLAKAQHSMGTASRSALIKLHTSEFSVPFGSPPMLHRAFLRFTYEELLAKSLSFASDADIRVCRTDYTNPNCGCSLAELDDLFDNATLMDLNNCRESWLSELVLIRANTINTGLVRELVFLNNVK